MRRCWDLIVLSVVVAEAFHRDATKNNSIGGGVVYGTNELLGIFRGLRVLRYDDVESEADFGLPKTRVVRLAAQKPR